MVREVKCERNRNVRGSFLFLDQTKENKFGGEGKEKKKRKEERKERRGKQKRREKNPCVGKKEKGERKEKGESWLCTLQFPVFQRSEFDRPRIKVGLLNESYELVPKIKRGGGILLHRFLLI